MKGLSASSACERAIYRFALLLDDPTTRAAIGELFTDEGVLEIPSTSRRVEGRGPITRYFAGFPSDLVSRRVCSNVIVDVIDPQHAHATSYFTTFKLFGSPGPGTPPPPPTQIGLYEDDFRRVGGDWLISKRRVIVTFAADTPSAA
jgi:hypothetical protein